MLQRGLRVPISHLLLQPQRPAFPHRRAHHPKSESGFLAPQPGLPYFPPRPGSSCAVRAGELGALLWWFFTFWETFFTYFLF